MATIDRRLSQVFAFAAGTVVLFAGSNPARAYWDMGWGFGGFNYASPTTDFLNQRAAIQGGGVHAPAASRGSHATSPRSYLNSIRDNGFVPRFDVTRRRPPGPEPAPQPATVAPAPTRVFPLASFFDASQKIMWPSDAPSNGALKAKRDRSDQATLAVLEETRRQSAASISSVTYARELLLEYGRPALQQIREQATPRIADTFHAFLLALYDSLAQAAAPPGLGSAPRTQP